MEPIVVAILSGTAVAAIVTGIINLIIWRWDRKAKLEDDGNERNRQIQGIQDSLLSIAEAIDELSERQSEMSDKISESEDKNMKMFKILYSAQIREIADKALKAGEITLREKQTLHELHEAYHNECEGNGFFDELLADCDELTVIP